MSIWRQAAKSDDSQKKIVLSLRAVHVEVWIIRRPCDLLTRFWCDRHRDFCWQPLEVKTPASRTGRPRGRLDQQTQTDFLIATNTPVVTDLDTALRELNKRHALSVESKARHILQSLGRN